MAERLWRSKWTISSEKGVVTNRGVLLVKQVASSLLIGQRVNVSWPTLRLWATPYHGSACWSRENYYLDVRARRTLISLSFGFFLVVYVV